MMKYLIVFGVSMLPILELRGSLIYAAVEGIELWQAFPIAIVGNLIPVPFILFLFRWALGFFSRVKFIGAVLQRFWDKAQEKAKKIEKSALVGVFLFVAVPIPGTGAWMGSLIATVLGLDRKKAMLVVLAGVLCAGAIMSLICYLLPDLFHSFFLKGN